jgi:hypothetical protein
MTRGAFVVVLLLTSACRRDSDFTVVEGPQASATASAKPVDHLAPNELLEGDAKAFGLTLPRGVRLDQSFADVAYASGAVDTHAAALYVRARTREGKMIEPSFAGDGKTTFDHVRVPALPDKQLDISVRPAQGAVGVTLFEVRDVTPTKAPTLPDEAARWRNAGLTPNGRVLDPTHLQ